MIDQSKSDDRLFQNLDVADKMAVEERLWKILFSVLRQDCRTISLDTMLIDVGELTSLAIVTLLLSIEQEFGIVLGNSEIGHLITLGDLFVLVQQKLGDKGS